MYLPPTADQRPTRSRHVQLPHEESSRRSLSSAAQGTRAASIATPLVVANEPSDFLAYGFYGGGAAATFCRAAKRGIDMTHPRARSGACNCGSYLDVAEDVAAADDHGALLADQADKEHDKQQSPYRSGPNRGYTKGSLGRHVYEHLTSAYEHLLLPARLLGLLFGRSFDSFPSRAPGTSFDDSRQRFYISRQIGFCDCRSRTSPTNSPRSPGLSRLNRWRSWKALACRRRGRGIPDTGGSTGLLNQQSMARVGPPLRNAATKAFTEPPCQGTLRGEA